MPKTLGDKPEAPDIDASRSLTPPTRTQLDPQESVLRDSFAEPERMSPHLGLGQVLAKRFTLTRFLGSGGMGDVYAANDQVLGEQVALKVIRSRFECSDSIRKRLKREVQLARRVTHRNVCRIFDLNQHEDEETGAVLDIVSMELIEGETLAALLSRGPMPVSKALPIVREIVRGLATAHRRGIVHRDLKPANVMMEPDLNGFRVVITDFGLAQQLGPQADGDSALTQEGGFVGTPNYMAPEQVSDQEMSPATDIYSLGIMLFEMLSGKLPFKSGSPWQTAALRLASEPMPLNTYLPDIDPDILAVVNRCLKQDPTQRYPSSQSLLDDLDLIGSCAPHSSSAWLAPISSRRLSIWLAVFCAVVALSFGSAWWSASSDTESLPIWSEAPPRQESRDALRTRLKVFPSIPAVEALAAPRLTDSDQADLAKALELADSQIATYEGPAAVETIEQALKDLPAHPLLELRLAEAYWRAGRDQEALQAIERSTRYLDSMDWELRQFSEGLYQCYQGHWRVGRDILYGLWQSTRQLQHGLWTLEAHFHSARKDSVAELIADLRSLPGVQGQDPRIDLWESRILSSAGPGEEAIAIARRAVEKAEQSGQTELMYEGKRSLIGALLRDSEPAEANRLALLQAQLLQGLDNPYYQAMAVFDQAARSDRLGQVEEARISLKKSIAGLQELGSTRGLCRLYLWHGSILAGTSEAKIKQLKLAKGYCEESGLLELEAWVFQNMAWVLERDGRFEQALEYLQESSDLREAIEDKRGLVSVHLTFADTLSALGRMDEALQRVKTAFEWNPAPREQDSIWGLLVATEIAIVAGRMGQAETWLNEAAELQPIGRRILELYGLRCRLEIAKGETDGLKFALRSLKEHNRTIQDSYFENAAITFEAALAELEGRIEESRRLLESTEVGQKAQAHLARLQIRAGDRQAASRTLEALDTRLQATTRQDTRWYAGLVRAELLALDSPKVAAEQLRAIELEAIEDGHHPMALEVKLSRGRLIAAPQLLRETRDEAQRLGLLALAHRADQALAGV